MRHVLLALTLVACGRMNPPGAPDAGLDAAFVDGGGRDAGAVDASPGDGGRDVGSADAGRADAGGRDAAADAAATMCPESDLGSMEGERVATGSTLGAPGRLTASCASGEASPARTFRWTAPRAGTFVFDTLGSEFDTALVVRAGTCDGRERGCSDDTDTELASSLAVTLGAGDIVVLFVAGYDGAEAGAFVLSIREGAADEIGRCGDGTDDDFDGAADCLDGDCSSDPSCTELDCANGVDDDGDLVADCEDFDCASDPACTEACGNGIDDDGDAAIDCADFDCARDAACFEDCGNGIDDDLDGATDCEDAFCGRDPRCVEVDCTNGVDDDRDGFTDCDDFECVRDPGCGPVVGGCGSIFCAPELVCIECPEGPSCVPPGSPC
jgi:hypothetical protein